MCYENNRVASSNKNIGEIRDVPRKVMDYEKLF
jgi:hypothetical protein